ncbi:MAG: putative niacin/nicotinamide transporter NaiP [Turneriella sp.]|nr:putative niacin/nicotinamide transporter NaiP [Turneriella sp.]
MSQISRAAKVAIVVAALGYFVDIYDLLLFGIVRVPSLQTLGVPDAMMKEVGATLLNYQMFGMLLGGIVWGILGDKKGRLSVLFGSIFLYSIANFANAFVDRFDNATALKLYEYLRFIAGFGLAGELGAGITLVSELMPIEKRGYGTMIVAGFGILGAVVATLIGDVFKWQTAYIIGSVMGFLLLIFRIGVYESGMYEKTATQNVARGNFFYLFTSRERFMRYLRSILIGVPLWFAVGILVIFSREFGTALGATFTVNPGHAIGFMYAGLSVGDFLTGYISQRIGSRRKVVLACQILNIGALLLYLFSRGFGPVYFYTLCVFLGLINGYWAVFVTIGAEQFGTNLRATVATTVPNFVRGSVPLLTTAFLFFDQKVFGVALVNSAEGMVPAALIVGGGALLLGIWATLTIPETHGKDLNYIES